MINRIYWDLDETLISAYYFGGGEEFPYDVGISVEGDIYHIKINPFAWKVLNFSRNLVGPENVWLLTQGVRDYAHSAIRVCDLKFPTEQVLAREDIKHLAPRVMFDPEFENPYKHKHNVLIDNLPPRYNEDKMAILGIDQDRYHRVDDFYGIVNEYFEENVISFLKEKYNEEI